MSTPRFSIHHWAFIQEVTFVHGIRFLFWICCMFGRWPFRLFLYPVIFWYVLINRRARTASKKYLEKIAFMHGNAFRKVGLFDIYRHFFSFGENILEKMLVWNGFFDPDAVHLHTIPLLENCLEKKRGFLLICSHFGNLELCKALSRHRPHFRITMLVHTKHATVFNNMLRQLDPESQLNLVQVTEISPSTAIMLAEKIQQGECVVIAGDRVPVHGNSRIAHASFLGEKACFPVGPYIIGSLLQCPVFMMFSVQTPQSSDIFFELLDESIRLPSNGRKERLNSLAATYAGRLEHYCLQSPLQWFNFYDFWENPFSKTTDAK